MVMAIENWVMWKKDSQVESGFTYTIIRPLMTTVRKAVVYF